MDAVGKLTNVMKDLSTTTFIISVLDRNSPLAYSIASDKTTWRNHPTFQHCGMEIALRYVLKKWHVIEWRYLTKVIKRSCERYWYVAKRTIVMTMWSISRWNMTLAPAFYFTIGIVRTIPIIISSTQKDISQDLVGRYGWLLHHRIHPCNENIHIRSWNTEADHVRRE